MDQKWFKDLNGYRFLDGREWQNSAYSQYFKIRLKKGGYYVAWNDGYTRQVDGTPMFQVFSDAKKYLFNNWNTLLDNEFEKEILGGSKVCEADNSAKD